MSIKEFNKYVEKLSNLSLENFSDNIKAYSKFLSYVNPDYQYNGTYLEQYIEEFVEVCIALPSKEKIYKEIVKLIIVMKVDCNVIDIMVDNAYHGYYSKTDELLKVEYVAFDKEKMTSKSIEIRAIFEKDNEEYIFHKEYDDLDNNLLLRISKDIDKFLNLQS